jgi:hypothetical protein
MIDSEEPDPDRFSFEAAKRARDEAMARAKAAAEAAWVRAVQDVIIWVAVNQLFLSTNNVWVRLANLDVPEPHENRTLGPYMLAAARKGFIEKTERTTPSIRKSRHHADIRVWKSLLFRGI